MSTLLWPTALKEHYSKEPAMQTFACRLQARKRLCSHEIQERPERECLDAAVKLTPVPATPTVYGGHDSSPSRITIRLIPRAHTLRPCAAAQGRHLRAERLHGLEARGEEQRVRVADHRVRALAARRNHLQHRMAQVG
jgi:hypothetical protein